MCSTETNSSDIFFAIIEASFNVFIVSLVNDNSAPDTFTKLSNSLSNIFLTISSLIFVFFKRKGITFSSISIIALNICSFSI